MRLRSFLLGFVLASILFCLGFAAFILMDRGKAGSPKASGESTTSLPVPMERQPPSQPQLAPSLAESSRPSREELQRLIAMQREQLGDMRSDNDYAQRQIATLQDRLHKMAPLGPAPAASPVLPVAAVPPAPIATPVPTIEVASAPDASSVTTEEQECAQNQPCRVRVFFATDRKEVTGARVPSQFRTLAHYFGGDRELDSKIGLQFGACFVTIPRAHYLKYSGKLDYKGTYDPETSIFIKDIELSKKDDWLASLNQRIEKDPAHEMLVFIHGYNVTFVDAVRRTAQIYYDLGFKGAPVTYSWPSGGNLWNYWADEASVEWSTEHLRDFLDMLAKQTHARRIHLIAHSMGGRALTHALAEIGALNAADVRPECKTTMEKFQEVILAAPDLDTDLFLQLEASIKNAAKRITLYASKRDRAVLASWILHRFRRLGVPGKTAPPEIDAIDASAASNDILGHSYYGESVLWDVKLMIEKPDLAIEKRCTVKREKDKGFYTFLPQPKVQPPKRITRMMKSIFHKSEQPETISATTCPIPAAAPAGGG
jgi:esterase/lipase superfamily enzyme